jgi:hypothetical protein
MGGRRDEGEWWREQIQVQYCKNFCKCHNVPPPSTTIKKKFSIKYLENKLDKLKRSYSRIEWVLSEAWFNI